MTPFRYADYESQLMDLDYIRMLQRPRVHFFKECERVLDLGCGPGVFLELLKEAGIEAIGVDRDEEIVKKASLKGLNVIHSDLVDWVEKSEDKYDGIFCSHLMEHLPFGRVVRLVELIIMRLSPGGVLVVVLPNPGSIRLHLFGFWRDPEHIRFYTGNLIASVCQHYGLKLVYSNEEETPNRLEVPRLDPMPPLDHGGKGFFHGKKGDMELFLQEFNKHIEAFNQKIERFSEALNKIWSRDDEVVLVLRKPL
ncbi:MAG TPA: class I SAM-dependent methyltransferase [Thermodesulfobacteriota bacterium]|nr:class I SAM-dependent methyltransferase [Thermodesulfobacteriota bacterium]